jgi:hypothetical protein
MFLLLGAVATYFNQVLSGRVFEFMFHSLDSAVNVRQPEHHLHIHHQPHPNPNPTHSQLPITNPNPITFPASAPTQSPTFSMVHS